MNRNVQLLALAGGVAVALAATWWATSGGQHPGGWALSTTGESIPTAEETTVPDLQPPPRESSAADRRFAYDLPAAPRLVSGTVRDGRGNPVAGAHVFVTELSAGVRSLEASGVLASCSSDAQGRFEIRATVQPLGLFAHAEKTGFLDSKSISFLRGAEGVELTLQSSGLVSGRLLLDPWVSTDRITMEIAATPVDGPESEVGLSYASNRQVESLPGSRLPPTSLYRIDDEGRFAVGGFFAPTVTVTVQVADAPGQMLEIRDVHVQGAGAVPDPRLDPIDLRGKFERVAVEVLDDAGRKANGARVALHDPEHPELQRSQSTRDGRTEFFAWSGAHDFEVSLEGFRTSRLAAVYGDQVVRLRRGIPVHVRVGGSRARPPPPDLLGVGFLKGSRTRPMLDGIGTLQDSFQATFVVASPGVHEVGWYLSRGSVQAYLETRPIVTVDVRDQDAVQEFVLELPASAETAWTERMAAFERTEREESESADFGVDFKRPGK